MQEKMHPTYEDTTITCACGNVIHTRSTKKDIRVEICSKCHPFFTGKQKLVDTGGRVDRFKKRFGLLHALCVAAGFHLHHAVKALGVHDSAGSGAEEHRVLLVFLRVELPHIDENAVVYVDESVRVGFVQSDNQGKSSGVIQMPDEK